MLWEHKLDLIVDETVFTSEHLTVGSTAATHQQRYWLVAKKDQGDLET